MKELNWNDITAGKTEQRERLANEIIANIPPDELQNVRLEECSDEYTRVRYGNAVVRKGKAVKIGGGGRNKGSRYSYQVWLVWN